MTLIVESEERTLNILRTGARIFSESLTPLNSLLLNTANEFLISNSIFSVQPNVHLVLFIHFND